MDQLFFDLFAMEERLPRPLRPWYRGAVASFGLFLGRRGKLFLANILLTLIVLAGVVQGLRLLALSVGLAVAAGAVGGAVSGLLEPLGRRGRAGEILRWTVAIFAGLATLSLLLPPVPFALPDPAFFWAAGALSILGAIGLVLTDDRSRSRLAPHQFEVIRSIASLRGAPERLWRATRVRIEDFERRRLALEAERSARPEARDELVRLLLVMRTDLGHVHAGLARFARLMGEPQPALRESELWLDRIDDWLEAAR